MAIDGNEIVRGSTLISYTTFIATSILISLSYHYYRNVYSYFKRRGVRGPAPYPLAGNLGSIMFGDRMKIEREWSKQYGKFYGVFYGTTPKFIVNDPEVLRQICIKDFDAMPNHEAGPLLNHYQHNFIFFSQDEHWKRLRVLQSPTFTSGKIKRMFKLLDRCADDLVLCFSEHLERGTQQVSKTIVNVKDIYSLYTMDAITSAAYTIKLDRKSSSSGKPASTRGDFVALALRLFELNFFKIFLHFTMPTWLLKADFLKNLPLYYFTDLDDRLRPIIKQRMQSAKKADDYLQILVDASIGEDIELNDLDDKENHHAALTRSSLQADQERMIKQIKDSNPDSHSAKKQVNGSSNIDISAALEAKLTDHEVVSSAIFLLAVGVETTATLLTNCTYALAFHLDIQQKLYETVKSIAEYNEETKEYSFDYDKLTSCEYLDAVISETLRNLSPVIQLDRVVSRDYYVEKYGVQLRKGDKLQLAYYAIMNNPEYWPEPARFDPERFMGDNKKKIVPGSYCPFGLGPRHCLGMRFSLTESKLALAKVLMKFRFFPMPGTRFPPESALATNLNNLKAPMVELASRVN